jgi:hypothetical protein
MASRIRPKKPTGPSGPTGPVQVTGVTGPSGPSGATGPAGPGDDLIFPAGNVTSKRPGSSQSFDIPWSRVASWNPWWKQYADEAKLPTPYLMALLSLVESNSKQCWSGERVCPRSDVVAAGDSFGDGQAIGILQVKHKLWQDFMPDADLWTAEGNIRLASHLMARFIAETGSWQNAIRQKYHPGTSGAGVTPQSYVNAIEELLREVGQASPVPAPTPVAMKEWDIPGLGKIKLPDSIIVRTILTPKGVHRPGRIVTMTGSTWHETGNRGNGAGAVMHSNWQDGCTQGHPDGYVGVTCYIENRLVIVKIPLNENSIHSGDWRNNAHPSMEVCVNADRNAEQTEDTAMWWQAAILLARGQNAVDHLYPHTPTGCPAIRNAAGKWPLAESEVNRRIGILKQGGTIPPPPTYPEAVPIPKGWDGTDYVAENGERFYALQRVFVTARDTAARKYASKSAPEVRAKLAAGEAFLAHYIVQGEGEMWYVSQYGSRVLAADCLPRMGVLISGNWVGDVPDEETAPILNDLSRGLSAETEVDYVPMTKAEFMVR